MAGLEAHYSARDIEAQILADIRTLERQDEVPGPKCLCRAPNITAPAPYLPAHRGARSAGVGSSISFVAAR